MVVITKYTELDDDFAEMHNMVELTDTTPNGYAQYFLGFESTCSNTGI